MATLTTESEAHELTIWVDADACPNVIKAVLYRAADKRKIKTVLVSNQALSVPRSANVSARRVSQGFDEADNAIVEMMSPEDIVITADLPLANDVIDKNGYAINPRGTLYSKDNIKSHLSRRDLMADLRDSGLVSGGPPPLDKKNVQDFANALDRLITRMTA